VLGAPLAFLTLMGALYWFTVGLGRRYRGALLVFFAALLLAITAFASFASNGPGPPVLAGGIAISLGLGWLGYRVQRRAPREPSAEPILAALVTLAPTTRALQPDDVLGQWRFYVDVAASTVTVDLQAGGRYEQLIDSNSGERIDGPGGEWTLDGPNLELSAYRSARQGATDCVRWFFGDCQNDLILCVKDELQAETMLAARRGETGGIPGQSPFSSDAAAAQASSVKRKAGSRSPSLFVPYGRLGHGGRPAR